MDDEKLNAEQLRARIEEEITIRQHLNDQVEQAQQEKDAATERQRLRRLLEAERQTTMSTRHVLAAFRRRRNHIDSDTDGPYLLDASDGSTPPSRPAPDSLSKLVATQDEFDSSVAENEFVWVIKGLSWLPFVLTQEARESTNSALFYVDTTDDDSVYQLVFSPDVGSLKASEEEGFTEFDDSYRGSLALVRKATQYGTNLDVRFYVRDPSSAEFAAWGEHKRLAVEPVSRDDEEQCCVLGPDLDQKAKGVFGLSFRDLLASRWVCNDSITFKVVIKEMVMRRHPDDGATIRLGARETFVETVPHVQLPPSTLAADLLAMLADGEHSDVAIEVAHGAAEPVRFAVHANVLSRRSAVFRAALAAGMRESATRTIRITDTPPRAVRALLHFLYTDDFEQVKAVLDEGKGASPPEDGASASASASASAASASASAASASASAASASASAAGDGASASSLDSGQQRMAQLQAVLAAAHVYQVCSLLGLAHLYDATALEQSCLKFIKANMKEVLVRPEYAALPPALLVKVQLHCAGVEPAESRKRKRSSDAE